MSAPASKQPHEKGATELLTFEQQMDNVSTIYVLWRHYFAENHPGDFKDCTDPACAPFTHLLDKEADRG